MDKKHPTDGRGQRTAKPGEIYAFYVDMLGRYGACQILEADGEGICYVLLDYLGAAAPMTLSEVWYMMDEVREDW